MTGKKRGISPLPDGSVNIAFDKEMIDLPLSQIDPSKPLAAALQTSAKYKQILSSIREVGIIEPPVVVPTNRARERFILLDGHIRILALRELGIETVVCLISNDDEAFTYNKHVNRLSPIQEHRMIQRAVKNGVPEEKIAKALNLDVQRIVLRRNLLDGICQEAAEMLKDKMVAMGVFPVLKRMKPYRQIEAVTLMNDAGIYSASYAKALFAATPKDQLTNPETPKNLKGISQEQIARLEGETTRVHQDFLSIQADYSTTILNLTLIKAHLSRWLGNANVVKYLALNDSDILREFQKIAEIKSLGDEAA